MPLTSLKGFLQPKSAREAAGLLRQYQDKALVVGGGTFIHGLVARGLVTDVEYLIDLSHLGLDQITVSGNQAEFGARATFESIENHSAIASSKPLGAVMDAMSYPPPQIKHAATIGGCVAAACPFLDLPIALLALDATAVVQGKWKTRKVPFEDFFVSLFASDMKTGEYLSSIKVPVQSVDSASAFIKLETNANDLSIVSVATNVSIKQGKFSDVRIFIGGGVGEVPYRASTVEAALMGKETSESVITSALETLKGHFDPLSDHRASSEYRQAMASVFTKRCLAKTLSKLGVEI